jgi:serine/threonine protein kinase
VDPVLANLIEEATRKLQTGSPVNADDYATDHPEQAEQLRRLLPAIEVLVQLERPEQELPKLADYRIVREIGRGGMGIVNEADQMSLGRRVALKVLPFAAALDDKRLQRFKQEAQAAARLHHTNIVPVHGVGCERGVHYYAMQYVEGQTLAPIHQEAERSTATTGALRPCLPFLCHQHAARPSHNPFLHPCG